jgi:hypothetical protein
MDFTHGGLFPFLNTGVEYRIDRVATSMDKRLSGMKYFLCRPFCSVKLQQGIWITNLEGGVNYTYHKDYFPVPIKTVSCRITPVLMPKYYLPISFRPEGCRLIPLLHSHSSHL